MTMPRIPDAVQVVAAILCVVTILLANGALTYKNVRSSDFWTEPKRHTILSMALADVVFALFALNVLYLSPLLSAGASCTVTSLAYVYCLLANCVCGLVVLSLGFEMWHRRMTVKSSFRIRCLTSFILSGFPWALGLCIVLPLCLGNVELGHCEFRESLEKSRTLIAAAIILPACAAVLVCVVVQRGLIQPASADQHWDNTSQVLTMSRKETSCLQAQPDSERSVYSSLPKLQPLSENAMTHQNERLEGFNPNTGHISMRQNLTIMTPILARRNLNCHKQHVEAKEKNDLAPKRHNHTSSISQEIQSTAQSPSSQSRLSTFSMIKHSSFNDIQHSMLNTIQQPTINDNSASAQINDHQSQIYDHPQPTLSNDLQLIYSNPNPNKDNRTPLIYSNPNPNKDNRNPLIYSNTNPNEDNRNPLIYSNTNPNEDNRNPLIYSNTNPNEDNRAPLIYSNPNPNEDNRNPLIYSNTNPNEDNRNPLIYSNTNPNEDNRAPLIYSNPNPNEDNRNPLIYSNTNPNEDNRSPLIYSNTNPNEDNRNPLIYSNTNPNEDNRNPLIYSNTNPNEDNRNPNPLIYINPNPSEDNRNPLTYRNPNPNVDNRNPLIYSNPNLIEDNRAPLIYSNPNPSEDNTIPLIYSNPNPNEDTRNPLIYSNLNPNEDTRNPLVYSNLNPNEDNRNPLIYSHPRPTEDSTFPLIYDHPQSTRTSFQRYLRLSMPQSTQPFDSQSQIYDNPPQADTVKLRMSNNVHLAHNEGWMASDEPPLSSDIVDYQPRLFFDFEPDHRVADACDEDVMEKDSVLGGSSCREEKRRLCCISVVYLVYVIVLISVYISVSDGLNRTISLLIMVIRSNTTPILLYNYSQY